MHRLNWIIITSFVFVAIAVAAAVVVVIVFACQRSKWATCSTCSSNKNQHMANTWIRMMFVKHGDQNECGHAQKYTHTLALVSGNWFVCAQQLFFHENQCCSLSIFALDRVHLHTHRTEVKSNKIWCGIQQFAPLIAMFFMVTTSNRNGVSGIENKN